MEQADPSHVFSDDYDPDHPKALALYCSDGRFTRGVERLVRHLGFERLDTLTMPGGPALLDTKSASLVEANAVRASVSFLVRGHELEEILLVAHEGCGYYRRRYALQTAEQIKAQQLVDLAAAAAWATRAHAGLRVDTYYASAREGRVVFDRVESGSR